MSLNITQTEINTLWDKGYRPFEIYTSNPEPVMYCGKMEETNAVGGWDIKHIFATRDEIENYPNFDCIIMVDSVAYCTEVFHGNEVKSNKSSNFTDLEMNVINILANNHKNLDDSGQWQSDDGEYPHLDTWELTIDGRPQNLTIFTKYDLDPKVYRGVISSLIQKGAIETDEYEAVAVTTKGRRVPTILQAIAINKETFKEVA